MYKETGIIIDDNFKQDIMKKEVTKSQANYYAYLKTPVWKEKRQETIVRDSGKCRLCNSSKSLHVHHRTYPKVYGEEPLGDLITLCKKCHDMFHGKRHLSKHQNKSHRLTKAEKRTKALLNKYIYSSKWIEPKRELAWIQ